MPTVALFREQQVRFSCCRQIRNTIAGVEKCRPWLIRPFLEVLCIWPNGQGFVMSKTAIVMELYLPASFLFLLLWASISTLIAHYFNIIGLWSVYIPESALPNQNIERTKERCCGVKQWLIAGAAPPKDEASIKFHAKEWLRPRRRGNVFTEKIYNEGHVSNKVFMELSYSERMSCNYRETRCALPNEMYQ